MTQIATVEKILDGQHAIISVPRKSACGHDCEECAGCGISGTAIRAKAINTVGATIGQKVVVESSTKKMLGIVGGANMGIGLMNILVPANFGWINLCGAALLYYALGRIHGKKEALEKDRLLRE